MVTSVAAVGGDNDVVSCVCCRDTLDDTREYYALADPNIARRQVCGHQLCCGCFSRAVVHKGSFTILPCMNRECDYMSSSWVHYKLPNDEGARPDPETYFVPPPTSNHDLANHPTQYYLSQTELFKRKHAIITVNTFNYDNTESSTNIQAVIPTNINHITDSEKKDLEGIGQYLHNLLIPEPSKSKATTCFNSTSTVRDLERADESTLFHFLHGLAIGTPLAKSRREADTKVTGRLNQRELNKVYAAADMLRSAKGVRRRSELMDLISNQLIISNAGDDLIRLLNWIGISRSKTSMDLSTDKAVDEKIRRGIPGGLEGSRYEFLEIQFDNLGAKGRPGQTKVGTLDLEEERRLGTEGGAGDDTIANVRRARDTDVQRGYIQYTTMVLKKVPVSKLIAWGIYPDPDHDDPANAECASRDRKDWNEEKESYEFSLDVHDGEVLLDQIVLPQTNEILSLLAGGILPGLEGVTAWLESDTSVEFDCSITRRVGSRIRVENEEEEDRDLGHTRLEEGDVNDADELDEFHNDGDAEEEEEEEQTQPTTVFEANDLIPDVPIQEDLNSTKTCASIAKYACGISKRMLESEDKEDIWHRYPADKRPEPIMEHTGPATCGDGAPIFTLLRLLQTKLKDLTFWAVFGGFHLLLELHKKRGFMFGGTHLRKIIGRWRPSSKQQDWFTNPGDPNQTDDESVPLYFAAYAAAAHVLVNKRIEEGLDANISAADLVQYTLEVEQQKPTARVILQDLRVMEVIFLLHLAEEQGNCKLFVTAMKFSVILFAVTHATKYVFMLAKFFIFWLCSSEAERILLEKALLFQKTVSGKTIFTDRFFEWIQRSLRTRVGKHYTFGFDNRLRQHMLTLDDKGLFKRCMQGEVGGKPDDSEDATNVLRMGKIYCETFKWFIDKKIWEMDGDMTLDVLSSDDGKTHVNPQILKIFEIGIERFSSYIKTYECGANRSVDRSDNTVNLASIQPTLEKRNEQDGKHRTRLVSTDVEVVTKLHNKKELELEYSNLMMEFGTYNNIAPFPQKNKSETKKVHYATAIVNARNILKDHVPDWEKNRLQEFDMDVATRDGEEQTQLQSSYSEMSGGVYITLGMNHEQIQTLRDAYSRTKYDLSALKYSSESGNGNDQMDLDNNNTNERERSSNNDGGENTAQRFTLDGLSGLSSLTID